MVGNILDRSMRVRFVDVDGETGFVREDLSLEDYNGSDRWRVRIESVLSDMEPLLEEVVEEPDPDAETLHSFESVEEEEECMAHVAGILSDLSLIESVSLEELADGT